MNRNASDVLQWLIEAVIADGKNDLTKAIENLDRVIDAADDWREKLYEARADQAYEDRLIAEKENL